MGKNFNNNPAFEMMNGYIENENINAENITTAKNENPVAKTFEPKRKETRSKKLLLLLKPTVFVKLQAKAQEYSISTNELINQILENNV